MQNDFIGFNPIKGSESPICFERLQVFTRRVNILFFMAMSSLVSSGHVTR